AGVKINLGNVGGNTFVLSTGSSGSITIGGSLTTTNAGVNSSINAGSGGSFTLASGGAIAFGANTLTVTADTMSFGGAAGSITGSNLSLVTGAAGSAAIGTA